MAEPNYMLYAEYMGRRNPYADVADKFSNAITDLQTAERQRAIDAENSKLRNIQIQQAQIGLQGSQREAAQQNELYQSLANAQPTTQFVPQGGGLYDMPSGIPSVMQPPTLDTSAPQTPSVFNTPGSIQTTQPDRLQIVLDHAMKYGALDQAKNAIDMQTLIRNSAPDKIAEREALQELGTFTAAMKNIKELQKSGLLTDSMLDGLYRMLPPKIQAYFPDGIQKDEVDTTTGDLLVKDPQTGEVIGRWITSPDGEKTQFVKESKETVSDFSVFYRGYKEQHPGATEAEISKAWHEQKTDEQKVVANIRIPAMALQGFDEAGNPIVFNRKTGAVSTGVTTDPTLGGAAADYAANKRALANDERQFDLMDKSERQAMGAAKLLRESSRNYKRTNVKFVNSFAALAREAVNDPKLSDLQMKLLAFSREYYKVTTNAYASAAELSVGAQQQADKMLNASNSYDALEAKINAAEQEMRNTKKTFKETIAERKKNLNSPASPKAKTDPLGIL